ncbi:unnamed protein product [Diplocarpon coronariae]|uniref:Arylsulfotransferase n=1 Tax=Diplocarpon coronariae TaxID=2795749 RepID=A0A218Z3E0_9HELO|nr:hypothetical protein JHW43_002068 [Diplocarpon mali]OWP01766.1 hypothetical protein B2J93_3428 [Marssonina coronariae]
MRPFFAAVFVSPALSLDSIYPNIGSAAFDSGYYGPYPNRSYITAPGITSPRHNILNSDQRCHDGLYIMTTLRGDNVDPKGQSPMIHDTNGSLVWMNATYGETFGHGVQRFREKDYLTFWRGNDKVHGHGEGMYFMLDEEYREVYRFTAGDGRLGDLHEFRITEQGTALITQYRYEKGEWGGPGLISQGYIWDSVFQELDIETGEVLFEWHAYDHIDIDTSDLPSGSEGRDQFSGYDFFHINSVEKDALGNYLISSRYYQCLLYISGTTSETLWQLGGKQNSFTDLSNGEATKFGWQHDARWTADYSGITLFDNGARYNLKPEVDASRGLHIALDLKAMTAEIKHLYINPRRIISASQGSMQVLPSSNVLIGYGYNAAWTEFTVHGEVLCDVHIGSQKYFDTGAVQTYKVSKQAWVGRPTTKPVARFLDGLLYVSWNGATEVRDWVVQGSNSTRMDKSWVMGEVKAHKTGFETEIRIDCRLWRFVRVRGVGVKGEVLGESDPESVDCGFEHPITKVKIPLVDSSLSSTWTGLLFELIACVLAVIAVYFIWRWKLYKDAYSLYQQVKYEFNY